MDEYYASFLQSAKWREARDFVIARDNGECQICGAKENLRVHHLLYDGDLLDPNYLVTLCERCHNDIHEFARVVREDNKYGDIRECKDALFTAMTKIVDKFVFRREITLNPKGDAYFLTRGHHGRMNKYLDALYNWCPNFDPQQIITPYWASISFKRYNDMRLMKKKIEEE